MHSEVEMTLTVSLLLDEMVNVLLNKIEKNEKGEDVSAPRNIPFRLKYRLTRNKATLDKDYKAYQQKQLMLLAKYGELTADGEHFEIKDPEKLELYKGNMEAALSTIVKHSVIKLEAEDLETLLEDNGINFTEGMLKVLISYLVNDEAFLDDITTEINWKTYQPPKPTSNIANTVAAVAATSQEIPTEIPSNSETPVATKEEVTALVTEEKVEEKTPKKRKTTKKTPKVEEVKTEVKVEEPEVEEKPKKKTSTKKTPAKETTKKTTTKKSTKKDKE